MKNMTTAQAILICFVIWFGWGRWQEYRIEHERIQRESREGYNRCLGMLSRCYDDACRQEQAPARKICAEAFGIEVTK